MYIDIVNDSVSQAVGLSVSQSITHVYKQTVLDLHIEGGRETERERKSCGLGKAKDKGGACIM